jgi:hypothetical protein
MLMNVKGHKIIKVLHFFSIWQEILWKVINIINALIHIINNSNNVHKSM